jgi:hypothetical protein
MEIGQSNIHQLTGYAQMSCPTDLKFAPDHFVAVPELDSGLRNFSQAQHTAIERGDTRTWPYAIVLRIPER